jgi:hypothetical protein
LKQKETHVSDFFVFGSLVFRSVLSGLVGASSSDGEESSEDDELEHLPKKEKKEK